VGFFLENNAAFLRVLPNRSRNGPFAAAK
jgi:hypothetical protein